MSLEEGSVECGGGWGVRADMCVRMCVRLFAPVLLLLHWRAAWQNHYGLWKHILTSRLKSPLPHTNPHTHTLTHVCVWAHILPTFASPSCRCGRLADTCAACSNCLLPHVCLQICKLKIWRKPHLLSDCSSCLVWHMALSIFSLVLLFFLLHFLALLHRFNWKGARSVQAPRNRLWVSAS